MGMKEEAFISLYNNFIIKCRLEFLNLNTIDVLDHGIVWGRANCSVHCGCLAAYLLSINYMPVALIPHL